MATADHAVMFRRTRERFEALEKMVAELLRRTEAPPAPSSAPSGDAMANLFGGMLKANVDLVGAMGDLAVRSVARRNGIRGGAANIRTAQRDRDGKFLPKRRTMEPRKPICPLCRYGESYPGVTVDMVKEHRAHLEARERGDRADDREQTTAGESSDEFNSGDQSPNGASGPIH